MLSIAYDDQKMADGLGAQIQRIVSIYTICKKFRLSARNLRVSEILLHPQDGILDRNSYFDLINRTNKLLEDTLGKSAAPQNPIHVDSLTARILLKNFVKYGWRFNTYTLVTANPYPVIERLPFIIKNLNKANKKKIQSLTIHVRSSGNRSGFVLKNERDSRNIGPQRYFELLDMLEKRLNNFRDLKVRVVTDAIAKQTDFQIQEKQESLWLLAGYDMNDGQIRFEPNPDIETIISHLQKNFRAEIIRGGDPLECLKVLMDSDILVTSRSSLSFSAGLIGSHSLVCSPRDFWHTAPRNWVTF